MKAMQWVGPLVSLHVSVPFPLKMAIARMAKERGVSVSEVTLALLVSAMEEGGKGEGHKCEGGILPNVEHAAV